MCFGIPRPWARRRAELRKQVLEGTADFSRPRSQSACIPGDTCEVKEPEDLACWEAALPKPVCVKVEVPAVGKRHLLSASCFFFFSFLSFFLFLFRFCFYFSCLVNISTGKFQPCLRWAKRKGNVSTPRPASPGRAEGPRGQACQRGQGCVCSGHWGVWRGVLREVDTGDVNSSYGLFSSFSNSFVIIAFCAQSM